MKVVVLLRSPRTGPERQEALAPLAPCDAAALGTALALQQQGAEVTALSAGPACDDGALAMALRHGARRALRIEDPIVGGNSPRTLATVLAAGLRQMDVDLVLAGQRSADWGTGATGPAVAHVLGVPSITAVEQVQLDQSSDPPTLLVTQRRERQQLELRVHGPALLCVQRGPALPPPLDAVSGTIAPLRFGELTLPFLRPLVSDSRDLVQHPDLEPRMLGDTTALAQLLKTLQ